MDKTRTVGLAAGAAVACLGAAAACVNPARAQPVSMTPATLPSVATIDERFLSYNVEMAEVTGGEFWKPYDTLGKTAQQPTSAPAASKSGGAGLQAGQGGAMYQARPPIDLTNARLRKLAAALGPAYVRVSGTWANSAYFHDSDAPAPAVPEYGGAPAGYDAAAYARDFAAFRPFAEAAAPDMRIAGPAAVGEAVLLPAMKPGAVSVLKTVDLLSAAPRPVFDVFSYHFYGAASIRCASMGAGAQTTAGAALSEEWLARADRGYAFYGGLRDRFEPGKPVWITEIADAACGGNPWADTFLDTFRYLDQHGRLAKQGVQVIFHNTLAASEYGLLDQNTFAPRPNYWAALLWHRLMGSTVLDAGPSRPGLHLYAQCLRGHPGGVTLLAINTSRTQPESVVLPTPADRYTLAAQKLEDAHVRLNGHELALGRNDELPSLQGSRVPSGPVTLAPATITFLAVADARNTSCR